MELDEQVLSLEIKASKLTFEMIRHAIEKAHSMRTEITHGKQSIEKLNRHGQALEMVDIPGADEKYFRKDLRRYGVDYAVMRDKHNGIYRVFFKARDVDRIRAALKNYLSKSVTQEPKKRSINDALQDATKRSKQLVAERTQLQQYDLQHGAR